jgi:HTH-type transcriptional regulator/antitoxin HigA
MEQWTPGWATHPGEHLAEYIEANGWSQAEFARLAGLTPKLVSTIVKGTNPVTPYTAIKLERVLGVKAYIWMNLQANWDIFHARAAENSAPETKWWLSHFPVKELKERGCLPDTKNEGVLLDALLRLFGAGTSAAYEAKVRALAVHHRQSKAHRGEESHVFTWLTLGEQKARRIELPPFDAGQFAQSVAEIRALTMETPSTFQPRMSELCQKAGVALVFEPPIGKTCLFGSARWLDADRAIIQMSLRMKSNDHFWWTFFHEAAHIALHRGQNFLDDEKGVGDGAETEADAWAEEILVGHDRFSQLKAAHPRTKAQVTAFAKKMAFIPESLSACSNTQALFRSAT